MPACRTRAHAARRCARNLASSARSETPSRQQHGSEERDGAERHEQHTEPRIAAVHEETAEQKPARQEQCGGVEQQGGAGRRARVRRVLRTECQSEHDMNEREQRAVRVAEPPGEPARFAIDVEVEGHLEAVERFQSEPERQEQEQSPEADAQVTEGQHRSSANQTTDAYHGRAKRSPAALPSRRAAGERELKAR